MFPRLARRTSVAGIWLALVLGACSAQTATDHPSPSADTAAVSITTAPSPIPATPVESRPDPPTAALAVEGGEPVIGQLGSYTWADGGSDSPWLPGSPLAAAVGEPLALTLIPGAPIADWTARVVTAGSSDGVGAVRLGSGSSSVSFVTPRAGTWSVQVEIRFADDLGSAVYYWRLMVR